MSTMHEGAVISLPMRNGNRPHRAEPQYVLMQTRSVAALLTDSTCANCRVDKIAVRIVCIRSDTRNGPHDTATIVNAKFAPMHSFSATDPADELNSIAHLD